MSDRYQEEQTFLDKTLAILKEEIKRLRKQHKENDREIHGINQYSWDSRGEIDELELVKEYEKFRDRKSIDDVGKTQLYRYLKAYNRPFFGTIEVDFDGEVEKLHLGPTSIKEGEDIIVNDWRCPIASLFYDSKFGNTSYDAPSGKIDCKLVGRSQIKIENGKIKRIVDSEIHLTDDELQEALSKSSDGKMKSIVSTIQSEQNDIIRNVKDKKILVQGCAGSGKTAVALHRISFLLYRDKKELSGKNVLIFSPSDVFTKYIANVLPELGEDGIRGTTFSFFAESFVKKFDKLESYTEFVSKYRDGLNTEEENRRNKFKFSAEYKKALDKFIQRMANSYRFTQDFMYSNLTIPVEYMNRLLNLKEFEKLPLQEKIDMVTDDVYKIYKKDGAVNKSSLRNAIARELVKPAFDPKSMYNKFLESEEYVQAYGKKDKKLNIHLLEYPDLIGMLYLNFEMMGYPENNIIHHLVIDEVQDYAPLQLEMMMKMFKGATITALGDANQTINPYHKYGSLEEMKDILGFGTRYIELNKAYRSSPEIMNYAKEIIDDTKIEPVRNRTDYEVVKKEVSKDKLFEELVRDIMTLKSYDFNNICIVTKSARETRAIYEGLKDIVPGIKVVTEKEEIGQDTFVSPSYLAKGLEFDAVIVYNDLDNPYNEEDKYLYYVACTRAQHDLTIYNEPKGLRKNLGGNK